MPKWKLSSHLLSSFSLSQHAKNHADWPTYFQIKLENPEIWLFETIFNHAQLEICTPSFMFLEFVFFVKNHVDSSIFSGDSADLQIL